jgi:hypothetical protein
VATQDQQYSASAYDTPPPMTTAPTPTLSEEKQDERDAADDRARNHDLSPTQRLERLEMLATQYFGSHHFEAPAPTFNPDAERESARAAFMKQMEAIEAKARGAN